MTEDKRTTEEKVKERCKEETVSIQGAQSSDDGISAEFVSQCFDLNRRGDGMLFSTIHRGAYLSNKTSKDEWFKWLGHYWKMDVLEERYTAVESVVEKYEEEIERLKEKIKEAASKEEQETLVKILQKRRDAVYGRIKSLHDDGADKCLKWAQRGENGLGVRGEEFDRDPWLLACKNGVIDLKTGHFRNGRPEDLLTKASPHIWEGIKKEAPVWNEFLNGVFGGDEDLIGFIKRAFGYGITGLARENIFLVLHGEGRNGKSTLVEIIKYVLGDTATPIQAELLLEQRSARSSAGPTPDIMALKGKRIAFASETDENRRFSSGKVKWLSGDDTLTGRNPHDKYEVTFSPTHLLCLLTNHLPHVSSDDFAFWQRFHLVPFKYKFLDDPKKEDERSRIKNLTEKLKAEAAGILGWLVEGCLEWQRDGLNPPPIVRAATEDARSKEDIIGAFIKACCHPPEDTDSEERTQFTDAYDAFTKWYIAHIGQEKYIPKRKKWGELMEKRFRKVEKSGYVWFYGLELSSEYQKDY